MLSSHRFVPKVFNGARQKGDGAQLDCVVVQVRGVEMGASFTIRACKKKKSSLSKTRDDHIVKLNALRRPRGGVKKVCEGQPRPTTHKRPIV